MLVTSIINGRSLEHSNSDTVELFITFSCLLKWHKHESSLIITSNGDNEKILCHYQMWLSFNERLAAKMHVIKINQSITLVQNTCYACSVQFIVGVSVICYVSLWYTFASRNNLKLELIKRRAIARARSFYARGVKRCL